MTRLTSVEGAGASERGFEGEHIRQLTIQQFRILVLAAAGRTSHQIGEELCLVQEVVEEAVETLGTEMGVVATVTGMRLSVDSRAADGSSRSLPRVAAPVSLIQRRGARAAESDSLLMS